METFLEILKYVIPAFIVFVATYLILKKFMDNEYRKQMLELRKENQKVATPLRLQAYERLALFLERISLNNLVNRVQKPGMSAKLLHSSLIITIKAEFEHNISQQIYVSSSAWNIIKVSKEEIIKIINIAFSQMAEDATGADLSKKIFEILMKLEASPTQIAATQIRKEVRQLF